MKIQLLTPEQHERLLSLYNSFPELTLENKGYECINKDSLSAEAKEANAEINTLLKNTISGFSSFQNFKHNKEGQILLRVQYNYNYDNNDLPFTGVGYIHLSELLNGFKD